MLTCRARAGRCANVGHGRAQLADEFVHLAREADGDRAVFVGSGLTLESLVVVAVAHEEVPNHGDAHQRLQDAVHEARVSHIIQSSQSKRPTRTWIDCLCILLQRGNVLCADT